MPPAMPGAPPPLRLLKVLIVDASAVGRQLAEFLLRQRGHIAEAAVSAEDALQRLGAAEPFDLLLVDASLGASDLQTLRRRAEAPDRRLTMCALISEDMAVPE